MGYFHYLMELAQLHSIFSASDGVTTDTRKVGPRKIFFALKGDRFNGNEFASEAIEKGAAYAVIDDEEFNTEPNCILVEDVLQTLQSLASYHRQQLNIPIIGITGSNGKTTTKELLFGVLSKKYRTLATKGNLNNHIGVPLTLLELNPEHEIAIIEMGANHVNEIALLSRIASPDYGLITNIGTAHIGEFGGQANIIKGKCELFDHIRTHGGKVFVNGESQILMGNSQGIDRIVYGKNAESSIDCQLISADPFLVFDWKDTKVETQLIGDYNLININAAIAIGENFEVDPNDICSAISAYDPDNNRSQLIIRGNTRIIMDAYNANPSSMEVALDNLSSMSAEKKMAILGDMLELGDESEAYHRSVIAKVEELGINTLFVGPEFMSHSNSSSFYPDAKSAIKGIGDLDLSDTLILIKGSRGIRLESLLEAI